jgi:1-acyl-sn-glycerol-3-phosphate acyltransferase
MIENKLRPGYWIARFLVRLIFFPLGKIRTLRVEKSDRPGAYILAANHISHFDPPIITVAMRRKVDWMAMAELYDNWFLGPFLRWVDAFPADRRRADRATIRGALERLRAGRIVGIFPEGGIRAGKTSALEGAPIRSGVATLAHWAGVPILPCVIVGTDRLYGKENLLPLRRVKVWIAFGDAIESPREMEKAAAREFLERELGAAFRRLFGELREKFSLSEDDIPQTPQRRMGKE